MEEIKIFSMTIKLKCRKKRRGEEIEEGEKEKRYGRVDDKRREEKIKMMGDKEKRRKERKGR